MVGLTEKRQEFWVGAVNGEKDLEDGLRKWG